MARSVERIEQDLAAMEEAIARLATDFHTTYSKYLAFLAQAVRQQLMLASYQVCTQGYPESFLSLSFNQRQQLQQSLRQLAKETQQELISAIENLNNSSQTTEEEEDEPELELTPESYPGETLLEQLSESLEKRVDSDTPPEPSPNLELTQTEPTEPTEPKHLLEWQEELEDAIAHILQTLSLQTNHLLQKMGIIPAQLPAKVLEAAAKAEASGEPTPGAANLLNLIVEAKNEEDSEDSTLTRIIAIHLRLSEIEFAEPTLTAARNQIRTLSAKTNKLHREYRKIQRERAVAQAEAAWRSSWYDD
ncbi:MAG TPA: hypothetical protein DCL61_26880 [Cyanobacteria bacterium UBA12227]|nr:hypothetical protein [Cyanobacteria bacterium UBA12227]HAX85596.1 hypothetical protein [Cyanobacteria bacterium UBA11370]HBY77914.1 hypothetical protein [Cyanobacteria bacterium UBA11148]